MSIKGQLTSLAERVEIGERWQAGQSDPHIAQVMQRPLATIRRWRLRYSVSRLTNSLCRFRLRLGENSCCAANWPVLLYETLVKFGGYEFMRLDSFFVLKTLCPSWLRVFVVNSPAI